MLSSEIVVYFAIIIALFGLAIWWIHTRPAKWKSTYSLILTILSIFFALTTCNYIEIKTDTKAIAKVQKSVIDSIKTSEKRLMDSQKQIKKLLSGQHGILIGKQDSLWAKIDSLDICIDKHFWRVNNRLSQIEGQLDTALRR